MLISSTPNAQVSPYHRIKRIPRSSYVQIKNSGQNNVIGYDPFGCGARQMEAEEVHNFLKLGLLENLRNTLKDSTTLIGCEHSSGLDLTRFLEH